MRGCILLILTFVFGLGASAQNKANISTPAQLDTLVEKAIQKHKAEPTLDGYRIQLFSGADRNNANNLRTQFKTEYPNVPVYLIYQQPYFKVRVGDFRDKLEAQQFYYQLQKTYEQLLIVPDKINMPPL